MIKTEISPTHRAYYADTYLDQLEVQVLAVGHDENGAYVVCDKTIFHPQGGGQPSDEGYLVKEDKWLKRINAMWLKS